MSNTIGQTLKGKRERLGMTLNELEKQTNVKRETLVLIENNDFEALKNPNYAEGIIMRYAKAVNTDSSILIHHHREELPQPAERQYDKSIEQFSGPNPPMYKTQNKDSRQLVIWLSGFIILTAVLWVLAVLFL